MKDNDILQTPEFVWKPLGPFDLDPCAGEFTKIGIGNWWIGNGFDGLKLQWTGFVWCNPPFSQKELWIEKMKAHGNGILILPERGSAPWPAHSASENRITNYRKGCWCKNSIINECKF